MFSGWQTFYQLTGSAAAELIGLLFIVATLSARRPPPGSEAGVKMFTTPTVFHLALVLVVSALALAPGAEIDSASLVMTAAALVGAGYAIAIAIRIARLPTHTHWSDPWFYGGAPVAAYLALACAAVAAWTRVPHAAYAVGLALLMLLLAAIRNAWDLVTWLAPRQSER